MRTPTIDGTITELTREQGRKMFDEVARAELGVSGNEFLRRLDEDDIPTRRQPLRHSSTRYAMQSPASEQPISLSARAHAARSVRRTPGR
jgi:hypothetical protein